MSAYTDQATLEEQFSAERVAEIFCVQVADGSTTGATDATTLARCIAYASAEVDEVLRGVYTVEQLATPSDSVIEITGIFTMYRGSLRRPEYQREPDKSPFYALARFARERLEKMRVAQSRMKPTEEPANVGGQLASQSPVTPAPFTFLSDPSTGTGGFNSGSF